MSISKWAATLVAVVLVVAVLGGCGKTPRSLTNYERRAAKKILALSIERRSVEFPKLDLSTQYAVMKYGMTMREPPASDLVALFADRGKDAVVFVSQRLGGSEDDEGVYDGLYVLTLVNASGSYDVARDGRLMRQLETRTERIIGPERRSACYQMLAKIRADTSEVKGRR